jgi:hypothetical protein
LTERCTTPIWVNKFENPSFIQPPSASAILLMKGVPKPLRLCWQKKDQPFPTGLEKLVI